MKSTLELPSRPLRNLQTRSVMLLMMWTLLDHLLPSLAAHLLWTMLLLCTLLAVLHPLLNATPPPHPLYKLLRGLFLRNLMVIVLNWGMMTFVLQEVRANQTRDREGPPPRAPRARETRLARRRGKGGARKPKLPLPLPTLRWHQCKVINYTKQSRQSVY